MPEHSSQSGGTLYIVATPIGNRNDMSARAISTLQACDWIACEDTRHSRRLFDYHGIDTHTLALHQHNENQQSDQLIKKLLDGQNGALVSDAGTPLISDPGFPLVRSAHQNGIKVTPIPGPSALITFLSAAAIQAQPFTFHGFLPAKSGQRQQQLKQWKPLDTTQVFYESSHRIMACLADIQSIFGPDATIAMGRELTKTYEQIVVTSVSDLAAQLQQNPAQQKGEFVVALPAAKAAEENQISREAQLLLNQLLPLLPPKTVAKVVADQFDLNKKQIYQHVLSLKNEQDA